MTVLIGDFDFVAKEIEFNPCGESYQLIVLLNVAKNG